MKERIRYLPQLISLRIGMQIKRKNFFTAKIRLAKYSLKVEMKNKKTKVRRHI